MALLLSFCLGGHSETIHDMPTYYGVGFCFPFWSAFRLSALTFSAVRAVLGAVAPRLVPLTFSPSFCRCPSALGRCPRVFPLSQAVLADFHAFGGLLTVCAFQILRFVPLGDLSALGGCCFPFCPVSVAVGAWVYWSVAVRLSVGVCSVRLFPLHSFRRSDLLRLGAFVRLPLGFGGLLLAVPRSPFSTVLRLFVPFVRSRFNLPFTLAVGIGSTLYCGSCPQCWRFMLCRSDGSPTFAVVGRLSSNYSFSLPI